MYPIDECFDVDFADDLARIESYNKHLYRPNTYLHKWWARRCGSTFRSILKHLVTDSTRQDYYTAGGLAGRIILDPMIGGGTTLHEALRLEASVIGADIDPIPVLQARATLSEVALADLEQAFAGLFAQLRPSLAPLFQTTCTRCHSLADMRFMLYGLRRLCHCGEAIFVDNFLLRRNSDGSRIHLDPLTHDIWHDQRLLSPAMTGRRLPLLERSQRVCPDCGRRYQEDRSLPYYQRYSPVALVGQCPHHKLFFKTPDRSDLQAVALANEHRENLPFNSTDFAVRPGPKSQSLLKRGIHNYLDLFSSRQLIYLHRCRELLSEFDRLPRLNLALLISTSLEFNALLCGYKGTAIRRAGAIKHAFARHAYTFPYTAAENNPVYPRRASGTLQNLFVSRIRRGRVWAQAPVERRAQGDQLEKVTIAGERDMGKEVTSFEGLAEGPRRFYLIQGPSSRLPLPDQCVDFVVTDPPYYDSVQYGDLAAFFRVWLRQLLPEEVPGEGRWDYSHADSAVDRRLPEDRQYTEVLAAVFGECHRVLKREDGRLIFTFHHWNPKGWAALTIALKRSQFRLISRYVVHAENPVSVHIAGQNALLHDAILVLAPAGARSESIAETGAAFPGHSRWPRPGFANKSNSEHFCLECGTMVGWMLDHDLSELDVAEQWHSFLAQER